VYTGLLYFFKQSNQHAADRICSISGQLVLPASMRLNGVWVKYGKPGWASSRTNPPSPRPPWWVFGPHKVSEQGELGYAYARLTTKETNWQNDGHYNYLPAAESWAQRRSATTKKTAKRRRSFPFPVHRINRRIGNVRLLPVLSRSLTADFSAAVRAFVAGSVLILMPAANSFADIC